SDILISSDSYEKVQDIFNVEKMPAIKVKGKEEPQTIYAVLGRKDDPTCPKSMKELRELIGMKFDEEAAAKSEKKEPKEEVKYEIL
ncbi:MAG TPA: adenylate cyclase-like protein, partial [Leptospiraceae bacterium]|nr:adenylate cyclase-like protein [Leptospiraceae bacterium]